MTRDEWDNLTPDEQWARYQDAVYPQALVLSWPVFGNFTMKREIDGQWYYDTAHLRPQSPANIRAYHELADQNGWPRNPNLPDCTEDTE